MAPWATTCEPTGVPPLESKETTRTAGAHAANKVMSDSTGDPKSYLGHAGAAVDRARHSSTAARMALEVTVAPETASTPSVPPASTILAGSSSMALEPMPGVSELGPTSTEAISPSLTVTVTGTSPPMPLPEAV